MYAEILIDQIVQVTERQAGDERWGFRKEISSSHQIFVVRKYCEKMKEKKTVYFCGVHGPKKSLGKKGQRGKMTKTVDIWSGWKGFGCPKASLRTLKRTCQGG